MNDEMTITNAQYYTDIQGNNAGIKAIIDGNKAAVPLCVGNKEYDEIMRQVEAGELTIQEAD